MAQEKVRGRKANNDVGKLLARKKMTLALAESCTGGLVSSMITDVPGSSSYFLGGVVAYSNGVKVLSLGVPASKIERYGAVSAPVALSMASGVAGLTGADIGASISGIAGPGGGTAKKPVGLAYMGFVSHRKKRTKKLLFKGSRKEIKEKFAKSLLGFISDNI
ncbi:MAG: nicotinamide-nucleotide amidohydrolase family protein [Candidatus Omnitrophica bacterium]|nr:nicotinamide-nucleotide amidohydrolase family protein [Candidatus Omnitrophota bacterium]MDD5487480.1 nicotinamide-nucleotide amidohydrolase family protein [Candidatus Omnitrophota bacterium]